MKRQPRSSQRSNKPLRTASIIGTGSYVPEKILTNADFSRMVDTSDEWITTRTGIKERRIAAKGEDTSDMGAKAALKAIEQAKISAKDIDLIMVATATPDMLFPATACFVQKKIGANKAACLDISAACAGFLFGLEIAQQFIMSHTHETVLVIGAEKKTSIKPGFRSKTSPVSFRTRQICASWRRSRTGSAFRATKCLSIWIATAIRPLQPSPSHSTKRIAAVESSAVITF